MGPKLQLIMNCVYVSCDVQYFHCLLHHNKQTEKFKFKFLIVSVYNCKFYMRERSQRLSHINSMSFWKQRFENKLKNALLYTPSGRIWATYLEKNNICSTVVKKLETQRNQQRSPTTQWLDFDNIFVNEDNWMFRGIFTGQYSMVSYQPFFFFF